VVLFLSSSSSSETAVTAGTAADEVPKEVEALDGINSDEEAHNADRPARRSLRKKGPRGKPLSEFSVGDTVTARVKTLASYGAFMDIGAESDGLLHISQLSVDYVADVKDVLEPGKEYEVRITKIDEGKKQVALSLLSAAEEEEAREAAARPKRQQDRPQRGGGGGGDGGGAATGAVLTALNEKGWDPTQFVDGTVVNVVDFGAFVRVDCSQLNSEVEGEVDGLVHISSLATGRVNAVDTVVNVDDKVKVRVKSIDNRKVSLTMLSVEEEEAKMEARGGGGGGGGGGAKDVMGNKDWKNNLEKLQEDMPKFKNGPVVVDLRDKK
jgi:predicted RNA-binding protein with RPS1 domain